MVKTVTVCEAGISELSTALSFYNAEEKLRLAQPALRNIVIVITRASTPGSQYLNRKYKKSGANKSRLTDDLIVCRQITIRDAQVCVGGFAGC